jgi:hypothetical protein
MPRDLASHCSSVNDILEFALLARIRSTDLLPFDGNLAVLGSLYCCLLLLEGRFLLLRDTFFFTPPEKLLIYFFIRVLRFNVKKACLDFGRFA